jgi:hypothetical protein
MSSESSVQDKTGLVVGVILAGLIIAGAIVVLVLSSSTNATSFYVAVAGMVLSPVFVLVAYVINRQRHTE